jgi:hypothetical protein
METNKYREILESRPFGYAQGWPSTSLRDLPSASLGDLPSASGKSNKIDY